MERPALVPELYVSDLGASLRFYVDVLGFRVEYERPEEKFASLSLGAAHLMLEEAVGFARATAEELARGQWRTAALEPPFGRGVNLEIRVPDLDAIDARLKRHGHPCLLEPHPRSYRVGDTPLDVRQLLIADPDGYLLRFSQPSARVRGPQ